MRVSNNDRIFIFGCTIPLMPKRDFAVMNQRLHVYTACLSMQVAERILDCADPLGAWNEPHYLSFSTLSSPSKKAETVITPAISLQYGTGQDRAPCTQWGFHEKWNKERVEPFPNILSFSTFFSLSLSLSLSSPHHLGCFVLDRQTHFITPWLQRCTHSLSLSRGEEGRLGSLSRLPIERVQHINTHKHAFLSLHRATAYAHLCHVHCIFVLMLSPLSQLTHTSVSQGPLITYCIATKTPVQNINSVKRNLISQTI